MIYISFDIGIKNLALCILKRDSNVLSILDWRIITLSESKKHFKGIDIITNTVYAELDKIIGDCENNGYCFVDTVIIENQPSNLNGAMKIIQMLIYSYFSLLKHWDNRIENVILINAIHKLQNHSYTPVGERSLKLDRREKYKLNKKDSIDICSYYIKNDEKLFKFFLSNKKKDDLADTLIQVISYIRKNELLIENVILNDNNFMIYS